jgi:hypothetical protein
MLRIWGKPIPNQDGTFHYETLGTEPVSVKEGESVTLDLGSN